MGKLLLLLFVAGCSAQGVPAVDNTATPSAIAAIPDMAACGGLNQPCCKLICTGSLVCAFGDSACASGGVCKTAADPYDYCSDGKTCQVCK